MTTSLGEWGREGDGRSEWCEEREGGRVRGEVWGGRELRQVQEVPVHMCHHLSVHDMYIHVHVHVHHTLDLQQCLHFTTPHFPPPPPPSPVSLINGDHEWSEPGFGVTGSIHFCPFVQQILTHLGMAIGGSQH